MKSYKQRNPVQFAPLERRRRRNIGAQTRAAQRRLERLASRQVLEPVSSIVPIVAQALPSANAAISAATSAIPTVAVVTAPPSVPMDNSAILAQLTASLNILVNKFNSLESSLNDKIAAIASNVGSLSRQDSNESMDPPSENED